MKIAFEVNGLRYETSDVLDFKDAFVEAAAAAELIKAAQCGMCGGGAVPSHRIHDGNSYFAFKCTACGAELGVGQRKDGGLFARRKDKSGEYMENNGWLKWAGKKAVAAAEEDTPF